jgi:hypothetical protein
MDFTLADAIDRLRPNTEWVIYDNCLEGLTFIKPKTTIKPTQAEVDAAIAGIIAEREAAAIKAATDKANALAKLAGLGLTDDEAKAVIGS